jgi:hypothetical protein
LGGDAFPASGTPRQHESIEHISLLSIDISDETWSLVIRSLTAHPRITFLSIENRWNSRYSAELKTIWMGAIIELIHLNTVIHTIEDVPEAFNDEEVYQNSILLRLEMNRTCFEVQRRAVKRADPSIRPQLLGRALHVVRYNPNQVSLKELPLVSSNGGRLFLGAS